MSSTYSTTAGDTFESVSRIVYGTEQEASRIRNANPGATEPFVAGVELIVPDVPGAPSDSTPSAPAENPEETVVLIEGNRFRFWESIRITRSIDSMDTLELSAPFDAEAPGFRSTFRPFSYKRTEVTIGGEPLFTGTMIGVTPAIDPTRKTLLVSSYSLPGVLNDCTAPASAFPLEFDNQNLREIATTLTGHFGLSVVFQGEAGSVFDRVALLPGTKVFSFLSDLAKQRNLIISSTPKGGLLFTQSTEAGSPVAQLRQGESPLLSVVPFFNPQEYYSHVTGIEPVLFGLQGSQFTVKNPRLLGVVRPITFEATDVISADIKTAVAAKAGRMFGNAASYSATVSTWRDPSGALWGPNSTVSLEAKDAMIYAPYSFIVRSVEFIRERAAETAVLNLVIPGSFSGQIPEDLPWDG